MKKFMQMCKAKIDKISQWIASHEKTKKKTNVFKNYNSLKMSSLKEQKRMKRISIIMHPSIHKKMDCLKFKFDYDF